MSVNFADFRRSSTAVVADSKADKPKAQFWLNVGTLVTAPNKEGVMEEQFVSLPQGIPLDTQEKEAIRGSNPLFNALVSAKNGLLDDIISFAQTLEPGEDRIIGGTEGGLCLQLRRVNSAPVPVADDANPFRVQLKFGQ